MAWVNSPKVKQPSKTISIKQIHNYPAETNFWEFVDGEKKLQDFSLISHFSRAVFQDFFGFQDFPG